MAQKWAKALAYQDFKGKGHGIVENFYFFNGEANFIITWGLIDGKEQRIQLSIKKVIWTEKGFNKCKTEIAKMKKDKFCTYNVGNSLRTAIKYSGMQPSKIARDLDISPQQLHRWTKNKDTKLSNIVMFIDYFKMDLNYFLNIGMHHE